jgi:hypothetical protein
MNEDNSNGTTARRIITGRDYIASLRGRNLTVYLFGERVAEPVDHPMIRRSRVSASAVFCTSLRAPPISWGKTKCSGGSVNSPAPAFSGVWGWMRSIRSTQ